MLTSINHTAPFSNTTFSSSSSCLPADVSPYTSVSSSSVPTAMDWSPDDVEMEIVDEVIEMDWSPDDAEMEIVDEVVEMDWSPDDVEMEIVDDDAAMDWDWDTAEPMDWSPDDVEMAD